MSSQRSYGDYRVAWINALPLEMSAARLMFDSIHESLPPKDNDINTYTLGEICHHNVVMVCLPAGVYGTTAAATVVAHMRSTFPAIQFGLMVGIAGGVPSRNVDIRLGDVVVSKPTGGFGGVVQYDLGKTVSSGHFQRTGMLNKPPEILLTAISKVQADWEKPIRGIITERLSQSEKFGDQFSYPGSDHDTLFEASCAHVESEDTCVSCDIDRVVRRKPRESEEPEVHYGLIASGNRVMKNGETRDRLAGIDGILCFEMEAAALMDQLPSLVVRGICDYSDSHKNKSWQNYAAITAAAYGRLLLSVVQPAKRPEQSRLFNGLFKTQANGQAETEWTVEERECLQRLFITDPEIDKKELKRRKGARARGTCEWIVETNELQKWLEGGESNILWLHGNPGSGKSTMAIMLADNLPQHASFVNGDKILSYFFCDSSLEDRRTSTGVLRGLLYQLIQAHPQLVKHIMPRYNVQGLKLFTSFASLWSVLMDMSMNIQEDIYCIIDALDECHDEAQDALLSQVTQMASADDAVIDQKMPHILITSRPYEEIAQHLTGFPNTDLGTYEKLQQDLNIFIQEKVNELSRKKKYPKSVAGQVSQLLKDKADGTFLWVSMACDELANVRARDAIKTLQVLPRTLHSLYETLLESVIEQAPDDRDTILKILRFVTVAHQPLTVLQLAEACELHPTLDLEERLSYTREDISMCRLLVVIQEERIWPLHKSVKDFLTRGQHSMIVDEPSAHADLSYRCIDYWLSQLSNPNTTHMIDTLSTKKFTDPSLLNTLKQSFLLYAAQSWPEHAHLAGSRFTIQERHEVFFQFRSQVREEWLNLLRDCHSTSKFQLEYFPPNFSILHIAARWGIPSLVDYTFDHWDPPTPIVDQQGQEAPLERITVCAMLSGGQTPIEQCVEVGQVDTLACLLDRCGDDLEVNDSLITLAAFGQTTGTTLITMLFDRGYKLRLTENGAIAVVSSGNKEILELLLSRVGDSFPTPRDLIGLVAYTRRSGMEIMRLLLSRFGERCPITARVVQAFARGSSQEFMAVALDRMGKWLPVTEAAIQGAIENHEHGLEILQLLHSRWCKKLPMPKRFDLRWLAGCSEDLLPFIIDQLSVFAVNHIFRGIDVSAWDDKDSQLLFIFQKRGDDLLLSEEVIEGIARTKSQELIASVLAKVGDSNMITEVAITNAARFGTGSTIRLFLHRLAEGTKITDEVALSAAANLHDGADVMNVLLGHFGVLLPMSERVTARAAWNEIQGLEIVTLLADYFGDRLPIGGESFFNALDNGETEFRTLDVLVERFAHRIPVSEKMIKAATLYPEIGTRLIRAMQAHLDDNGLSMDGDFMPALAAGGNLEIMASILNDNTGAISLTQDVLVSAARNELHGNEIMALLLEQDEGNLTLTEEVLEVAAENQGNGQGIMQLVFDTWKTRGLIDPPMLHTAALYAAKHGLVTDILLKHLESIPATHNIMRTIAVGPSSRALSRVLEEYGERFPITEDTLKTMVRRPSGDRMVALLVNQRQNNLPFSDDVVEAVCSWYHCENILTALLESHSNNVHITEEALVLCLVSQEMQNSVKRAIVIQYLERMPSTQRIFRVAVVNCDSEIISVLLGSKELKVTQEIVEAAATNEIYGQEILMMLQDYDSSKFEVTATMIEAAVGHYNGHRLLESLLYEWKRKGEGASAILRCLAKHGKAEALESLLCDLDDDALVTSEVIAAATSPYDTRTLKVLHERLGDKFEITEEILVAAALSCCTDTLRMILRLLPDKAIVSAEVLIAAVKLRDYFTERPAMEVLLGTLGESAPVTDAVLETAATSFHVDKKTLELLLDLAPGVRVTPRVVQAAVGNADKLEMLLLRGGEELELTNSLLLAAFQNDAAIKLLIRYKPEEVRRCLSAQVLLTAAGSGLARVLRLLHRRFAVDIDELLLISRFHKAVRNENQFMVESLLQDGVSPDIPDVRGQTPLWHASCKGDLPIVQLLLDTGAVDINSIDREGDSPLLKAAENRHTDVVRLLLQAGANAHHANAKGETAYAIADAKSYLRIMGMLEDYGGILIEKEA